LKVSPGLHESSCGRAIPTSPSIEDRGLGVTETRFPNDDRDVTEQEPAGAGPYGRLLELYERAVPQVYGYLLPRCGSMAEAEDLTAEVFLAAVRRPPEELNIAWLVAVARHKLVDQWRRDERDRERLAALAAEAPAEEDPWDAQLDSAQAHQVLAGLGGHHRAALTLRYLDGLPVPDVAQHLGRTVHATEALLTRARQAFRRAYEEGEAGD
jgi:RNA polymerase sigma-70 factor (ECF subfamily)